MLVDSGYAISAVRALQIGARGVAGRPPMEFELPLPRRTSLANVVPEGPSCGCAGWIDRTP